MASAPSISRILFVRHLPFKMSNEDLYDLFGRYGAVQQIRMGEAKNAKTRGTAFVVYEDVRSAKVAVEKLSGFNVAGRYLFVAYYNPKIAQKKLQEEKDRREMEALRKEFSIPAPSTSDAKEQRW